MKDKGFKIIFAIYLLLFLADVITTIWNSGTLPYLEVNPIYPYVGLTGIVIFNLIIIAGIYFIYNIERATPTTRFIMMNVMVVVIISRIFSLQNNIHYILNPVTVEQAKAIASMGAKEATLIAFAWLEYLPLFITIVTYMFWKIDHNVKKKKNKGHLSPSSK